MAKRGSRISPPLELIRQHLKIRAVQVRMDRYTCRNYKSRLHVAAMPILPPHKRRRLEDSEQGRRLVLLRPLQLPRERGL